MVLPMHLRMHTVEADQFREYKNQLSGLTTENINKVCDCIAALGLYTGPVSNAAVASASQVGAAAGGGPGAV